MLKSYSKADLKDLARELEESYYCLKLKYQLVNEIINYCKKKSLDKHDVAKIFPKYSILKTEKLLKGKFDRFSVEDLVGFLEHWNYRVSIKVEEKT